MVAHEGYGLAEQTVQLLVYHSAILSALLVTFAAYAMAPVATRPVVVIRYRQSPAEFVAAHSAGLRFDSKRLLSGLRSVRMMVEAFAYV